MNFKSILMTVFIDLYFKLPQHIFYVTYVYMKRYLKATAFNLHLSFQLFFSMLTEFIISQSGRRD